MISDIYLCQINTPQEEQGTSYYHGEFTYNLKEELQPGRQFITQKINIDMAVVSYCDNSANVYHPNKKKSGYFSISKRKINKKKIIQMNYPILTILKKLFIFLN